MWGNKKIFKPTLGHVNDNKQKQNNKQQQQENNQKQTNKVEQFILRANIATKTKFNVGLGNFPRRN